MSVDRGGLDYKITTAYDATGVEVFKLDIKALREEINGLKKDLSFKAVNVKIDRGDSVKELKASKKAIKEEAEELTRAEKALRNYVKQLENRLIKQEEANVAQEFSFELEKISQTANEKSRAAHAAVTKVIDKREQAQKRLAAVQEQGKVLDADEQKALGLLTEANIRLLAAKKKLEAVQSDAGNAELRSIQARTKAMQELNAQNLNRQTQLERIKLGLADPFPGSKLDQREAAIRISAQEKEDLRLRMAAQGLDIQGKPLPVPPTISDLADKIKLNAKNKEDLKQFLAAQGLGPDGKPLAIPLTAADKARNLILKSDEKDAITKLLLAQGRGPTGAPLPPTPPDKGFLDKVKGFLGLADGADGAEKAGGRALFTFRRLFGIFAAFTIARATIRGFFGLIGDAITLNSQLETTSLGIAALTTAVGSVKSATGQAVSASQAFALAQQEARRQTQLLRQEAVAAAVSFSAAVNAFQVGIAPGLRAGLNLDQVRQFAIQIAQAAKTLELADNQLAEEIRSILAGTIQSRTTRIATALGITNADIRRAKEMGTLSDLLNTKFKAFNSLSEAIGGTFEGAMARVKTAAELAIQQSSVGFFEELKGLLNDVLTLITDGATALGNFKPSPEAVAAFKILFSSLQSIVAQFRAAVSSAGLSGIVGAVQVLATTLEIAGAVVIGVLQGVFDLLRAITHAAILLRALFGTIPGVLGSWLPSLTTIVAQVVRVVAELYLIVKIATGIRAVFLVVLPVVTTLLTTLRAVAVTMGIIRARAVATAAANAAASAAANPLKALAVAAAIGIAVVAVDRLLGGMIDRLDGAANKIPDFGNAILTAFNFKPQVELAAESLQKFDEEMNKLREDTKKLNLEASVTSFDVAFDASHFELTGKVLEEAKLNLQRLVAIQQASAAKDREAKALAEGLSSAKQQEVTAQSRLLDLGKQANKTEQETINAFNDIKQLYDDKINSEQAIKSLQLDEIVRKQELAKAEADPLATNERILALVKERTTIAENIQAHKDIIKASEDRLLAVSASISEDQKAALAFVETAGQIVDAQGRQIVIQNTIATLTKARRDEELAINEQFNIRLALIAQEAALIFASQARINEARTADSRAQLEARKAFANAAVQEEIATRGAFNILRAQQALEQKNRDVEKAALDKRVEAKKEELAALQQELEDLTNRNRDTGGGVPENEIEAALARERAARLALIQLQGQQNALLIDQVRLEQDAAIAAEDAANKLAIAQLKASSNADDINAQIKLSLTLLNQQLPTQFEFIFDTLRGTITSFASFASSAITDAFDPSKTVDLKERFGRFLQGIAQQILQTLFQIAATKAALGLVTLFGFSTGGEVPALGRARGGPIPGRRRAQGFDGGGRTANTPWHGRRPSGLDSRDTVPVWARPGEWFVAPERSNLLGNDFMHQLAFGNVDPSALRAAAGLFGGPVVSAPAVASGPGFATGGFVSPSTSRAAASSPPSSGSQGPLPAYIVGGPQTVERFLRSGSAAAVAFFEEQGFRRN